MAIEKDLPAISTWTVASLSILFTLIYVLPLYRSPSTRPSPTLNRDAPIVIRARIRTVSVACLISTISTVYLIHHFTKPTFTTLETLHLLGYYPFLSPFTTSLLNPVLLTALLFLGPLFEKILIHHYSQYSWLRGPHSLLTTLSTPLGVRNYIAGPLTEEILFRSVLVSLHLLAKLPPSKIVFLTPLYFSIAHVHHFYEFTLTHPNAPILRALLMSLFQFAYTTLFGWYASFLYLRTGSLVAAVVVHSFCNWCGLPRFWGRLTVEAGVPIGPPAVGNDKDDGADDVVSYEWEEKDLGSVANSVYYILLFLGAYGFVRGLWPLTESSNALATFGKT